MLIAVIPARGGSKGIRRKNLRLLNAKPLISYVLEASIASRKIDVVIVTTDDYEIAEYCDNDSTNLTFNHFINYR